AAENRPLRLAIVGRPNVGKSSLLNRLLGTERSLTGPEAGITRDTVLAQMRSADRDILLHDTAGLRKKANVVERLEKLSTASALKAIRFADCVILVMELLPAVFEADMVWNTRVPTAALNRFLEAALERHPPPAIRGRRIRIRYMLQAKARPPTLVLFGTQLSQLPDSWRRYLMNELRKTF